MSGAEPCRGQCMCGAVRLTMPEPTNGYRACACDMCRRLTGSQFYSLWTAWSTVGIEGAEHVRNFPSSDWAERGFCGTCGSVLWYRPTDGRDAVGLSLGLFEIDTAINFAEQFYADKPICTLVRGLPATSMTEAETEAHFGAGT
ncbi:GFA family protein [Roseovarius aestuarii]|nr:GFA family protein [Roseovarius aestuarii]